MKPYRLAPDVYVLEDFVTEDQYSRVLDYISSLTESSWYIDTNLDQSNFFYGKQHPKKLPPVFEEIMQNLNNVVYSNYEDQYQHETFLVLQRHRGGHSMPEHRDNFKYSETPIRYGICIYYNDDYEGGAINYPELNIFHKPKARSLIIHGGNVLHGTTRVLGDNYRYFSTCFIKGTSEYPAYLNPELFRDIEESDGSFYY